jgi:hypothetical protein
MAVQAKALRALALGAKAARQVTALTFNPKLTRSYWPNEPRKSRIRIGAELLWWFIRYGEVNHYYYAYGLDRKRHTRQDVLPYRVFRRIRNARNLRSGRAYNYVCILRDKFLFAQLTSSLGLATPRPLALLEANRVTWLERDVTLPLESMFAPDAPALSGFCKPLDGIQGEGAFPLRLEGGRAWIRDEEITLEQLRARLQGRCLLQERIEQHPAMAALHPGSVNTVRLITFCNDGQVTLFSAALRVGTSGHSVDNWAAGGLIVAIDPRRGTLRREGFFKPGYGGRVQHHPDSGIRFEGYRIPHFEAAVQLVTRLHEHLRGIHSIGWDVAICQDGPVVIEGNDDWEGGIPMVLESDFKRRFLQMYEQPRRDHAGLVGALSRWPAALKTSK